MKKIFNKNKTENHQGNIQKHDEDKHREFRLYTDEICNVEIYKTMNNYTHHGDITCLDHCKQVAYLSYKWSKCLRLDSRSTVRGAMLHDFYLYDWHIKGSHSGLHGFKHPKISLENSGKYFKLNAIEKDIIKKHMWPLTITPPRYRESFVVLVVDKYVSLVEIVSYRYRKIKQKFKKQ